MSVTQITNFVQGTLTKGAGWYVESDASFTRTLTIGQILKARILRHYEGERYLADINGQQKVVDSTIPLRAGEVVHGRVAALGKRVHLKRVAHDTGEREAQKAIKQLRFSGNGQQLDELFTRYQVTLNPGDQAVLLHQIARASQPQLMALAGLVLHKLGTEIRPEFLNGIYRALTTSRLQEVVGNLDSPNRLEISKTTPSQAGSEETVQQLAGLLGDARFEARRRLSDYAQESIGIDPETFQRDKGNGSMQVDDRSEGGGKQKWYAPYQEWVLGQRLLNTQSEGSVNHRLTHFPLWFGDRMVEISVALFSQEKQSCSQDDIRHRRIVLSLETENLGHLSITVNLADRHLRLHLDAGEEAATERLALHFGELKTQLEGYGWEIDEIKYTSGAEVEDGAAMRAVVEHHITQDSLSRLM